MTILQRLKLKADGECIKFPFICQITKLLDEYKIKYTIKEKESISTKKLSNGKFTYLEHVSKKGQLLDIENGTITIDSSALDYNKQTYRHANEIIDLINLKVKEDEKLYK